MPVFTVHEPPRRAAGAAVDPQRIVFVRDGFHFWAFIAAWLWMLCHRMWLVFVIYVVVTTAVIGALRYAGVGDSGLVLVGLLIALLVGIEASTLRRFTLARRGWKNVGIVSGEDREDAERRFFDAWLHTSNDRTVPPGAAVAASAMPAPPTHASDIVGLFPDPGAGR
jgi:Protein of unknown function (DUF2628)